MLVSLLLAGIFEGIGLSTLLPFLNMATSLGSIPAETISSNLDNSGEFEQIVIDRLASLGITPDIGILLFIIVLALTMKNVLLLVARKQIGYTAARVTTDLRLAMLRAMLTTKWEYFLHQPAGKLANSLATEAHRSSQAYVNGAMLITLLIQTGIYLSLALMLSWKASIVCLGAGLVILSVSHYLVRMARRAGQKQTTLLISLLTRLTDTLQSVKPLKAMAREGLANAVLDMETTRLNRALQHQVLSGTLLNLTQDEMFTIIIALGMYLALVHYDMQLSTVMVLVVLLGKGLSQMGKVQKQYQKMVVCESAYWSLHSAIKQAEDAHETLGSGITPHLESSIRLVDVGFAYNEASILQNLSMDIPAGSLTTLVGPSGAGKTTVIDLIIGLFRPQSGTISIDGHKLDEIDLKGWRSKIGYVPQENLLLHDTVLHNITLGDPELDETDAESALRAASAWDFVDSLPDGLYSMVGERGAKLSGGQRQRIMIARALAHQPVLLILDEATSALDPESESAICNTIEGLKGKLTILAISHQQAIIDYADRIYRLQDGQATRLARQDLSNRKPHPDDETNEETPI